MYVWLHINNKYSDVSPKYKIYLNINDISLYKYCVYIEAYHLLKIQFQIYIAYLQSYVIFILFKILFLNIFCFLFFSLCKIMLQLIAIAYRDNIYMPISLNREQANFINKVYLNRLLKIDFIVFFYYLPVNVVIAYQKFIKISMNRYICSYSIWPFWV